MAMPIEMPTTMESTTPREKASRLANTARTSSPDAISSANATAIAEGDARNNGFT